MTDDALAHASERRYWTTRRLVLASASLTLLAVVVLGVLIAMGVISAITGIRAKLATEPKEYNVALVMPHGPQDDEFSEGVRLGVNEVNALGGIAGLPLKLEVVYEDPYSEESKLEKVVADSLGLADRVVRIPNLLAVIGHWSSATALPASSVYNRHETLYLASHATASSLTNHDFDFVFALQPSNADSASMIAHHALKMGIRKIVVLSDDTDYGTETTNLFTSWVTRGGMQVLYRGSLTSYGRSIDRLLTFLMENDVFTAKDIDAFFVSSSSVLDTARFIRRARELGLNVPIMGTDNMFSNRIENYVGLPLMKDVFGVSLYDEQSSTNQAMEFTTQFVLRYNKFPDQMAAIGYDAVKLLDFAVRQARSTESQALADKLHIMRYETRFVGATGPLVFDRKGLVTDTDAFIVRHNGKSFHTVASYQKPLNWDLIDLEREAHDASKVTPTNDRKSDSSIMNSTK